MTDSTKLAYQLYKWTMQWHLIEPVLLVRSTLYSPDQKATVSKNSIVCGKMHLHCLTCVTLILFSSLNAQRKKYCTLSLTIITLISGNNFISH